MSEELKPCPFCGGECKIKAAEKEYIGFTIWCECENCHAQASGYCPDMKNERTVNRSRKQIAGCVFRRQWTRGRHQKNGLRKLERSWSFPGRCASAP